MTTKTVRFGYPAEGPRARDEMFRYIPGMQIDDHDFHTIRGRSYEVATKLRNGTIEICDGVKIDSLPRYR
jgi:hypothetical protein